MNRDTRELAAFVRIHSISHVITRVLHTPQHFQMLQTKAKLTKSWVCFSYEKLTQSFGQISSSGRTTFDGSLKIFWAFRLILEVRVEATSKYQALIETPKGSAKIINVFFLNRCPPPLRHRSRNKSVITVIAYAWFSLFSKKNRFSCFIMSCRVPLLCSTLEFQQYHQLTQKDS